MNIHALGCEPACFSFSVPAGGNGRSTVRSDQGGGNGSIFSGDAYISSSSESGINTYDPVAIMQTAADNVTGECSCGESERCLAVSALLDRFDLKVRVADARLSEEERMQLDELRRRDAEVRAHEQAHVAAGASNATYEFERGPDGGMYAVGGQAQIDMNAPGGDAETKIAKARQARQAALAPGNPSAQDLRVAAQAAQLEMQSRMELVQEKREEQQ